MLIYLKFTLNLLLNSLFVFRFSSKSCKPFFYCPDRSVWILLVIEQLHLLYLVCAAKLLKFMSALFYQIYKQWCPTLLIILLVTIEFDSIVNDIFSKSHCPFNFLQNLDKFLIIRRTYKIVKIFYNLNYKLR